MKERIRKQITCLESEIDSRIKRLEDQVKEFKEHVEKYDSGSIVTFVPGMVASIDEERKRIAALDEKLRMLVWLLKGEEV